MDYDHAPPRFGHEPESAVSWPAIFAGAVTALAASFVLTALVAGFGLKYGSPYPGVRGPVLDFTPTVGAFMVVVQVLAAGLGGYLAGRLRTKWLHVHGHEVHFRDTAHGLIAWAMATVAGVFLGAGLAPSPVDLANAAEVDPSTMNHAAEIAAQLSLFLGFGLLLSAFTACVAAAIGGMRRDHIHGLFWDQHRRP